MKASLFVPHERSRDPRMGSDYQVRDVMTVPATTISQDSPLMEAALLLRSTGIRHLPIVDGERLVGIITDRDIQRCAPSVIGGTTPEEYNSLLERTPLVKVMVRNPLFVSPETRLSEAAALLIEYKYGCLPVVEQGRVVGMLTVIDMLGAFRSLLLGELAPAPAGGAGPRR